MKHVRTMYPVQMVELLPVNDTGQATDRLCFAAATLPVDYYEHEVAKGFFKATLVTKCGVPMYRIIWQLADLGRCLAILGVVDLAGSDGDTAVLGLGIDRLAEQNCVKRITMSTSRRGLVKQCESWGAVVTGVLLEKRL